MLHPILRLERAKGLLQDGKPQSALKLLKGAFPSVLSRDKDYLAAEALRDQGFFDRALTLYRRVLAGSGRDDPSLWLDSCLGAVKALRSLGQVAEGRRILERGLALARRCRLTSYRWQLGLEEALLDRAEGRYARSIKKLTPFLTDFKKEGDWAGAGYILWALGGARRFSGDLESSRRDFTKSLYFFKRGKDSSGMAYALFGLGGVTRIQGRLEEAERHYTAAGKRLAGGSDIFGRAYAHCGLANVLRQRGRLQAARKLYLLSHALYSRLEDRVDLAYVDWGLGKIALHEGKLREADNRLRTALKAFAAGNEVRGVVLSENALAALLHARGKTVRAEALFDRAVRRARQAGLHAHLEIFT